MVHNLEIHLTKAQHNNLMAHKPIKMSYSQLVHNEKAHAMHHLHVGGELIDRSIDSLINTKPLRICHGDIIGGSFYSTMRDGARQGLSYLRDNAGQIAEAIKRNVPEQFVKNAASAGMHAIGTATGHPNIGKYGSHFTDQAISAAYRHDFSKPFNNQYGSGFNFNDVGNTVKSNFRPAINAAIIGIANEIDNKAGTDNRDAIDNGVNKTLDKLNIGAGLKKHRNTKTKKGGWMNDFSTGVEKEIDRVHNRPNIGAGFKKKKRSKKGGDFLDDLRGGFDSVVDTVRGGVDNVVNAVTTPVKDIAQQAKQDIGSTSSGVFKSLGNALRKNIRPIITGAIATGVNVATESPAGSLASPLISAGVDTTLDAANLGFGFGKASEVIRAGKTFKEGYGFEHLSFAGQVNRKSRIYNPKRLSKTGGSFLQIGGSFLPL